jgi:hypothetical protein
MDTVPEYSGTKTLSPSKKINLWISEKNLLASNKISASEIKRLRNEYLEIAPYLPMCCTTDGQKVGGFQKGIEIFILS